MAFQDPSSSFFGPDRGGREESRGTNRIALENIPSAANIGSPNSISIKNPGSVQYKEDKTWETVFKGAASLGNTAIEATDAVIKLDIDNSLRKGVRNIQEQHFAEATAMKEDILDSSTEDNKSSTPIGLQQGMTRMDTLMKAKRYGSISDTNYYVQLGDVVSGLKSKYAGYEREIDNKIKEISGVDPANAVRASMQNDIDALKAAAKTKRSDDEKWIDQNVQYFAHLPDWKMKSMPWLKEYTAKAQAQEYQGKLYDTEVARLEKEGKDPVNTADRAIREKLTNLSTKAINETFDALGGQDFLKRMAAGQLSPEELKNGVAALNQLELRYNQGAAALMSAKIDGLPGETYGTILSRGNQQSRVENAIKYGASVITGMRDMLGSKDSTAALNLYGTLSKQLADKVGYDIHRNNNTFMIIETIRKSAGDQYMTRLAIQPDQDGNTIEQEAVKASRLAFRLKNASETTSGKGTMSAQVQRLEADINTTPRQWKDFVEDKTEILSNPNYNPETQRAAAQVIFGDGNKTYFLRKVGASESMNVFTRFINDDISKNMSKLGPETLKQYADWATANFENVFKRTGDTVKDTALSSPNSTTKYNPETNRIELEPTPAALKMFGGSRAAFERSLPIGLRTSVDKLNQGIMAMENVYKNAGMDPKTEIPAMLNGLKLDTIGQGERSFWQQLRFDLNSRDSDRETKRRQLIREAPQDVIPPRLGAVIKQGEAPQGYTSVFGGTDPALTSKTVSTILAEGKNGRESSARGGWQIMGNTLRDAVKAGVISNEDVFTEANQDKVALWLMKRRGLDDYRSGKLSKGAFIDNLSKEWAALPNTSGRGSYDGDGLNRANVPLAQLIDALDNIDKNISLDS